MKYFMKALQIMAFVSSWSATALEDGKVTAKEGIELVVGICNVLGVPAELDLAEVEQQIKKAIK